MSRPAGSARRSGDPRKRAAADQPADDGSRRRLLLVVLAVAAVGLVLLALLLPDDEEAQEPASAGLEHAVVACDLTSKAQEAAGVETDARLAASVLLLDQAIIASERAAGTDPAFADLDEAVQAVHTAGHRGDPEEWQAAMDTALATCSDATD